jgi:hypothetical protein
MNEHTFKDFIVDATKKCFGGMTFSTYKRKHLPADISPVQEQFLELFFQHYSKKYKHMRQQELEQIRKEQGR